MPEPAEPVRITEFLKPGVDEAATILPAALGRRLTRWAEKRGLSKKLHLPLHIRTDTLWGYTLMRAMAGMKRRRRKGLRFAREQDMIERWLRAVPKAAQKSYALGLEAAECGRLIKGYSDTRERAFSNFDRDLFRHRRTGAKLGRRWRYGRPLAARCAHRSPGG